ncbi:ATP-dependent DNA helicase [Nadsonia fulvescens var. elongata DSM 6958]|uniref:ATP-dependent DNA helicase n=1 Tax=Nadsonia fulvescens var. elongata DSM 6958 TaxID=857566 RepID=A0A1E3PG93_9ASCO|nr:ATP-dependent DNA helicase [Nadsonia fulvescens var. elongata DSM 6958]
MDYRGQGEDVIPDSSDEFELIEDDQKAHSSFQKQYQDQDPDEDLIFLSSQEFKQSENSRLVESSPPSTIHFSQPDVTSNDVEKYSWIPEVYDNLYNRFNLEHFRNNQLEAINATLSGQDVLVLMPTGGGKSLCYQLPAMIKCNRGPMTTLVISPLLSLMEDQVFSLLEKDIVADMISSNESKIKKKLLLQSLAKNELSLLYVSPEMLNTNKTLKKTLLKLASQKQLARFVIDEAHCVSSWGHDFRPDYKVLDNLKHEFPLVPIMALTATANDKVCQDIVGCLRSNNYRLFKQSFNRPNLTYEVVIKDNDKQTMEYIVKFITQRHPGQAGIIYCHSRAECEKTAFELKKARIKAEHYHSSLDSNFKTQVQMSWQRGKLQVICATVAFGMGIDKADVRYVVHLTMSKNIEGYYQETGRAGRDGKPSDCILLYNYKDTSRVRNLINTNDNVDDTARTVSKNMLTDMIMYAENSVICRRAQILKYFGEDISNLKCHKKCDNCKRNNVNNMIEKDMTEISQAIIRLIEKLQRDRVTITYCVDVIKGAKAKKIVQAGHDRLVGYGAGKDIDKETISRILYHLVAQRILDEYSIVNNAGFAQSYLHLSDRCRDVNKGYLRVKVKFPRQEIVGDGKFTHLKAPTQAKNKQKAKTSIEKDKLQKRIQFRPSQMPGATKDIGKPSAGPGESHTNDRFVDNVKILSGAREERKKQLEASRADAVVNKATLEDMANKLPKDKESFSQLDKIKPAQVEAHYEHFKRYIALIRLTQGKTDIEEK